MEHKKPPKTVKDKFKRLIEILVIIAIVGVLSAVAIPNVGKFIVRGEPQLEEPASYTIYVLEQGQKREIEQIEIGKVQIWYPDTMRMGDSKEILFELIPSPEIVSDTNITVSNNSSDFYYKVSDVTQLRPIMLAELKAVNFEISGQPSFYQEVPLSSITVWRWSIAPKAVGEQLLIMILTAPVKVQGFEQQVAEAVYSRSFNISVTKGFDWASFWQAPFWQAIVAILGILGWILLFVEKRKESRKKSQNQARQRSDSVSHNNNINGEP